MRYDLSTDHPLTDAACREATGKTMGEWFALLDAWDALKQGRRSSVQHLHDQGLRGDWWLVTLAVEYELARAAPLKDGRHTGYGICVTKTVNAPLSRVWELWTQPAELDRWWGGGTQAKVADGGTFANADGDRGSYARVRPEKDLRLSWENPAFSAPTLVDVAFSAKGEAKSHVMLNHTRIQSRAEADGLRRAWGGAFDQLKAIAES